MTSGPTIDYEALQQEAMRGVVRSVLQETERSGLPGEHHFYISFNTRAPGVILSRRLKEKYQHEMTIVLQHRFWGLVVSDDRFEVNLTFDGIPERLVVPFQAIRVFVDPSVRYGLQFEIADIGPDPTTALPADEIDAGVSAITGKQPAPREPARTTTPRKRNAKRAAKQDEPAAAEAKPAAHPAAHKDTPLEPTPDVAAEPAAQDSGRANIVSLDAFRKR
ncbi:MAG TPA: ClpXP protease specificity-enhancing factor SspB [Hyphomicrobiaceae bacterium]|nr:ClpXP protease specificity-enhancing factor SspB [Hyphomicrobiaceae bacterium]